LAAADGVLATGAGRARQQHLATIVTLGCRGLYTIDQSLSVQDLMVVMKREAVVFLAGCCSTH